MKQNKTTIQKLKLIEKLVKELVIQNKSLKKK